MARTPRKADAPSNTQPVKPVPVKPKANRKRPPAPKDEVERSDRYMNSTAQGEANAMALANTKKLQDLKALLHPETAAMAKVMVDIAKNRKVHASIRLEAASRVLDRVYGKAKEHVVVEDPTFGSGATDEVTMLLNNILEAVGAPQLTVESPASSPDGPAPAED